MIFLLWEFNLLLDLLLMEITIHEESGVIVRHFSGEVHFDDIIESWTKLLADYPNLKAYKGILTNYLDANVKDNERNLNVLVDFLQGNLDQLRDLKIAVVQDTPMITNTIILGQKVKSLQIRPFSTVDAAMRWVRL